MKPARKAPSLVLFNGIGTRFSGSRDFDRETQSHVTTMVLSFLFIPVLALSAWRIIPAAGGRFHVLGREPLSPLARRANIALLALAVALIGFVSWQSHVNSPGYRADQAMARAAAAMKEGKPLEAMREYRSVVENKWPRVNEARGAYPAAFEAALRTGPLAMRCQAVQEAREATVGSAALLKAEAALVLAWSKTEPDAETAAAVMKAALPSVPASDHKAYAVQRCAVLEKVTAAKPANAEAAIDLAAIYDEDGRTDDCRRLLEPHRAVLGITEGARIYGRMLVHDGSHREGAELLRAYSKPKLAEYHRVEKKLEDTYKSLSDAALRRLNSNQGPPAFYRDYEKAGKDGQEQLVSEFISGEVRKSQVFTSLQDQLAGAATIVPVMLDLGIALLHTAQEEADPAKRKQGLEEAEQSFLAISNSAGETTEYRLFLGQVYYWMGKLKEGKALFDELVASEKRGNVVVLVSESLRQVGEMEEGRRVAELAWKNAATPEDRTAAAQQRALMYRDSDERIVWLERCEIKSPVIEIDLMEARAHQHMGKGRRAEAVPLLRSALAGYDQQPRSASVLNNSANLFSSLFSITHDPADAREALDRHEEASRLQPDNTVLQSNLVVSYMHQVWLDLASASADLKTLPAGSEYVLASLLHENEAGQQKLTAQLSAAEPLRKAALLLEKLMVLSPREPSHCREMQQLHALCRRADGLKKLLTHVRAAGYDHAEMWTAARKQWSENNDAESIAAAGERRKEAEAALAALKPGASPEVRAALHILILQSRVEVSSTDNSGKAEDFITEAEALLKLHKGYGSTSAAESALLRAAVLQGMADGEFAAFVKAHRRYVGDMDLLALALQKGIAVKTITASPALGQWLKLSAASAAAYPDGRGVSEWALLRKLAPDAAAVCGEAILKSERILAGLELDQALTPFNISNVIDTCFLDQLRGDAAAAEALWKESAAKGMPLPPL